MSEVDADSPTRGSFPRDWGRWSGWAWAGIVATTIALVTGVVLLHHGTWIAVLLGAFALVTPLLAAIDLRWHVVPDRIVVPGTAVILLLALATGFADGNPSRVLGSLLGAAAFFAVYLVLALIAPKSMGMGDVKLAALIGAVVGALTWPSWFVALFAGFVAGALIGLVAIMSRRAGLRSHIPYAPALLLGAWVAVFVDAVGK